MKHERKKRDFTEIMQEINKKSDDEIIKELAFRFDYVSECLKEKYGCEGTWTIDESVLKS